MCDLVSKRTELYIDSLLKRGYGNHCIGRLSSCGARRKKLCDRVRPHGSCHWVENMIALYALGPIFELLQASLLQRLAHFFERTISPQSALCWIIVGPLQQS